MKIKHITLLFCTVALLSSFAAKAESSPAKTEKTSRQTEELKPARQKLISSDQNVFRAGVLIGTDIGGAVPVPFRYIPSTFNPYPQLNLDMGIFAEFRLQDRWSLGANFIYKTVGMKADARVSNQKYEDQEAGLLQYYTGTAKMDMSFTMFEVPFYAKYTFGNHVSRLLFGGYFTYNLKAEFETLATKGYSGGQPDKVEVIIEKGGKPLNMSFTSSLRDFDAGVLVGYEHSVYNRLNIGIRLSMGFLDIFQRDTKYFDYKMLHMRGTIIVGYRLFH